jgi:hypothetical protein
LSKNPTKSYKKWIQKGVSELQLEAACKADLIHHYVFADYAISLDTRLQHIILPREAEMDLLNVQPQKLETIWPKNGLYRTTVNDTIEAQGETLVISNIKEDLQLLNKSESSFKTDITMQLKTLAQVTRDVQSLKTQQEARLHKLQEEQKNDSKQINSIYTVNEDLIHRDFAELEYSKTSVTWSILGWSIFSILILILAAILFFTLKRFRYQLNTLYTALNANNHPALRRLIIDFFTQ